MGHLVQIAKNERAILYLEGPIALGMVPTEILTIYHNIFLLLLLSVRNSYFHIEDSFVFCLFMSLSLLPGSRPEACHALLRALGSQTFSHDAI